MSAQLPLTSLKNSRGSAKAASGGDGEEEGQPPDRVAADPAGRTSLQDRRRRGVFLGFGCGSVLAEGEETSCSLGESLVYGVGSG